MHCEIKTNSINNNDAFQKQCTYESITYPYFPDIIPSRLHSNLKESFLYPAYAIATSFDFYLLIC